MGLGARDEDARCDDGVQRFAARRLFLVRMFVELFGNDTDRFGQRELIAPARNVAKRGQEVPLGTRILGARRSPRAMPVVPSLKPMMVSSCSMRSIRGSEAAPTCEGSSPSSFASVLGIGKAEPLLAKKTMSCAFAHTHHSLRVSTIRSPRTNPLTLRSSGVIITVNSKARSSSSQR
jgi:hypothetical protein